MPLTEKSAGRGKASKRTRAYSTRSSSSRESSKTIRNDGRRLMQLLKANKLMAVGKFEDFNQRDMNNAKNPNGWYAPMPGNPTPFEFKAYIRSAARSKRVVTIDLRNPASTFTTRAQQDDILRFIATQIPKSRWICVNMGEYSMASDGAYNELLRAIKQSSVGYLFLDDTRIKKDSTLKEEFLQAIQHNRKTNEVLHLLLTHPDTRAVLDKGCKAWRNPSALRRTIEWATTHQQSTDGYGHCRNRCIAPRCNGLNAKGQRCCICTRDRSGFCRFHRPRLNHN